MPTLTIRNLPDEVHRALRLRAARHGRSMEAELRAILIEAAKPRARLKLGSMLVDIGRRMKISNDEITLLNQRDRSAPRDVDVE